jgi:hypothetical protein
MPENPKLEDDARKTSTVLDGDSATGSAKAWVWSFGKIALAITLVLAILSLAFPAYYRNSGGRDLPIGHHFFFSQHARIDWSNTIHSFLLLSSASLGSFWLIAVVISRAKLAKPNHGTRSEGQLSRPAKTTKLLRIAVVCVTVAFGAGVFFLIGGRYREFRAELRVFEGITLSDRRDDILYRLGYPTEVAAPDPWIGPPGVWAPPAGTLRVFYVKGPDGDQNTMPKNTTVRDYPKWSYTNPRTSGRLSVNFNKADSVTSLEFYSPSKNPFEWEPIAGIRAGQSEDDVLKLGTPTRMSVDGVTKRIEFSDIGVSFYLTTGDVYMCVVQSPTSGEGAIIRRFLHASIF